MEFCEMDFHEMILFRKMSYNRHQCTVLFRTNQILAELLSVQQLNNSIRINHNGKKKTSNKTKTQSA